MPQNMKDRCIEERVLTLGLYILLLISNVTSRNLSEYPEHQFCPLLTGSCAYSAGLSYRIERIQVSLCST